MLQRDKGKFTWHVSNDGCGWGPCLAHHLGSTKTLSLQAHTEIFPAEEEEGKQCKGAGGVLGEGGSRGYILVLWEQDAHAAKGCFGRQGCGCICVYVPMLVVQAMGLARAKGIDAAGEQDHSVAGNQVECPATL